MEHNLQISKWSKFVLKVYTSDYIIFLNNVEKKRYQGCNRSHFPMKALPETGDSFSSLKFYRKKGASLIIAMLGSGGVVPFKTSSGSHSLRSSGATEGQEYTLIKVRPCKQKVPWGFSTFLVPLF